MIRQRWLARLRDELFGRDPDVPAVVVFLLNLLAFGGAIWILMVIEAEVRR